jgi:arylsulfatase A-like enzyme
VLDAHHRRLDDALAELFGKADPHTVVMVISDHGYRFLRNSPLSEEAHDPAGVWVALGGPVRRGVAGADAVGYDFAPTVLYLLGYPVPAGLRGQVRTDLLEPAFVAAHPVRTGR